MRALRIRVPVALSIANIASVRLPGIIVGIFRFACHEMRSRICIDRDRKEGIPALSSKIGAVDQALARRVETDDETVAKTHDRGIPFHRRRVAQRQESSRSHSDVVSPAM